MRRGACSKEGVLARSAVGRHASTSPHKHGAGRRGLRYSSIVWQGARAGAISCFHADTTVHDTTVHHMGCYSLGSIVCTQEKAIAAKNAASPAK